MALNPGDTLSNGHHRIIRQLGRGGFGFVYLSEDTLLAEEVAIKELIPALVRDEAMLSGVSSEARQSCLGREAEGRGTGQRHVHHQQSEPV